MIRSLIPLLLLVSFAVSSALSGCGTLFGNTKIDEKADDYQVLDLTKMNPDWQKLETPKDKEDKDKEPTDVSDVTYQSKKTSSIISLNTSCRPHPTDQDKDLRELTALMLLGMSDITLRTEREVTLQATPALETTVRGKLNQQPVQIQTVVTRRAQCDYDMMYVARPQNFESQQPEFSRFVQSLRLR